MPPSRQGRRVYCDDTCTRDEVLSFLKPSDTKVTFTDFQHVIPKLPDHILRIEIVGNLQGVDGFPEDLEELTINQVHSARVRVFDMLPLPSKLVKFTLEEVTTEDVDAEEEGEPLPLPRLPPNLLELYVSLSGVKSFPRVLPPALQILGAASNPKMEAVPTLPSGLEEVNLSYNAHTKIPRLPDSVTVVNFDGNPLEESFEIMYAQYKKDRNLTQLKRSVNAWWDSQKGGKRKSRRRTTKKRKTLKRK